MEDFTKTKGAGATGELLSFSENPRSVSDSPCSLSESENEPVTLLLKEKTVNFDCEGRDLNLDTWVTNVSVVDLCDYSQTNFGNDSSVMIWRAINSFANYAQWKQFYCYMCNNIFLDAELHLDHMLSKHLYFKSTDNIILLPISVKNSATGWSLDWKEPSLAWFKFMYDDEYNPNCFTKTIESSKCSDKRTRLLKQIGESFDLLLSHNLSTSHLARLIERTTNHFIAGLRDEKLVVAREILDQTSQLPIGMLDENCLELVLKQIKRLEGLFIRQGAKMQDCDEFKVQNNEFLDSISLDDTFNTLHFDPTKLSPEPEEPIRVQFPWNNAETREIFSKVFKRISSQIHLLYAKFERKQELLRSWDFVIILEQMLFTNNSRSSIESSLEEWRDRFSDVPSEGHNFNKNFICNVLRKSRQSQSSIEVIFRELKYQQILDELDVVDIEISHVLAQLEKSEKELSVVCAFDYRMSFLPILKCFIRANIKSKSDLTMETENESSTIALNAPAKQSPKMFLKTPVVINNKVEIGIEQTLDFWRSLTEEKKKELFTVEPHSIYNYSYYNLRSPWLENVVYKATQFFILYEQWRFFTCINCSMSFPNEETIIKHIANAHFSIPYWGWQFPAEPIGESQLAKVLLEMDWTPIDGWSALNMFEEMSLLHGCKDYALMQWPTVKDDKRTKRLNLLKDHMHTLLRQKPSILSYTHLQTMIDLASEQAFSQLTPTKYRSTFTRVLSHSPVSFRLLDSKSLARFVVHFSIIRRITKSYLESLYEGDSESEDYDSEREIDVMDGGFNYNDTENDVFWKKRENIDAITFNLVGSFELDFRKLLLENDESLLLWVLDAPLVPKIPKIPHKIILLLGLAREFKSEVVDNQLEVHEMHDLHYYITHLEEYACFKRWMQLGGSSSSGSYDLIILKRYEELLSKTPMAFGDHKSQHGTSCNNCIENASRSSSCYTCCVSCIQMKKKYSISKQTQYHINTWQSINRLKALEPLASRTLDLDYRVIILPLIRSLIRMKLEAWVNCGGSEESDKVAENN